MPPPDEHARSAADDADDADARPPGSTEAISEKLSVGDKAEANTDRHPRGLMPPPAAIATAPGERNNRVVSTATASTATYTEEDAVDADKADKADQTEKHSRPAGRGAETNRRRSADNHPYTNRNKTGPDGIAADPYRGRHSYHGHHRDHRDHRRSHEQHGRPSMHSIRHIAAAVAALPTVLHYVEPVQPPGLPSLEYNMWDHRKKLTIMTLLLMTEFAFLPIALYYPLWYRTNLSHGVLFAIITSFFGLVTGVEFAIRSWRLIQRAPTYRPINGRRWGLDTTHWILTTVYSIMTALLIGASIPKEPLVRPLALPSSIFLLFMAVLLLGSGLLHRRAYVTPWAVSSVPAGARLPPLTYTLLEDVVAVDGGAGLALRERVVARYAASWRFRLLLAQLNWVWGVGSLLGGIMTVIVLWTVPRDVAYGFGWGAPLVVVSVLAIFTLYYARLRLRQEKALWATDDQA